MGQLRVRLLGSFSLNRGQDQEPLPLPTLNNGRILLAYLLLNRERPHPRSQLAFLIAPDVPERRARRSLSRTLWDMRQALPFDIIQSEADVIRVRQDAPIWVDVEAFTGLVAPHMPAQRLTPATAADLRQAIELYRGHLLEGYYEDWLLLRREQLRENYLQALLLLSGWEKENGRYSQAVDLALKLTQADPLREAGHREVMRLYAALQRPQAALQQFEICRQVLRQELGLEPGGETMALAQAIAHRPDVAEAPYLPSIPARSTAVVFDPDASMPLIGREAERAALLQHLAAMFEGAGGVIFLSGGPGIGKSRLLQEMARDAEWRGAWATWGECLELTAVAPYAPIIKSLTACLSPMRIKQLYALMDDVWLTAAAPLFPAIARALPDLSPLPDLEADQSQARLLEALTQLLLALSKLNPLVVILEDIHWADQETLDTLVYLSRRLSQSRVALLCSYRKWEAREETAVWQKLQAIDAAGIRGRLALKPLNAAAAAQLIRQGLGMRRNAPHFAARLHEQSGGNPLFLLETLRVLHDEGLLTRDGQGDWRTPYDETTADYAEITIPAAQTELIQRRLSHLTAHERQTLHTTAVIGNVIDFQVLQAANPLPPSETLTTLAQLVRRQFLVETPHNYRFSHDTTRRVVYDAIPPAERAARHGQLARALAKEPSTSPTTLLYHYERGQLWGEAVTAAIAAGRQATSIHAITAAIAAYNKAMDWLERYRPLPDAEAQRLQFDILAARSKLYGLQNNAAAQEADLTAMRRLAITPGQCAATLLQQADFMCWKTAYDQALQTAQQALALAQKAALPTLIAESWQMMGQVFYLQEQYEQARQLFQQAIHQWQACGNQDEREMLIQFKLARTYQKTGDVETAVALCNDILPHADETNHVLLSLEIHSLLGQIAGWDGRFADAIAHMETSLEQVRSLGSLDKEARLLGNLAYVHWSLRDYGQAVVKTKESLAIFLKVGNERNAQIAYVNLGGLYRETGRYETAFENLQEGLRLARKMRVPATEAWTWCSLCHFHLEQNQLQPATAALGKAEALMADNQETYTEAVIHFSRGWQAQTEGRYADSTAHFEAAEKTYQQAGATDFVRATRSFLACSLCATGEAEAALAISQPVIEALAAEAGGEFILESYWHHAQILEALGMETAVTETLEKAAAILQTQAATLPDDDWRDAFLTNVPVNQAILSAWEARRVHSLTCQLPRAGAPLGRPLRPDEYVTVVWTINTPADRQIPAKAARRRRQLLRLLREAQAAGAAPAYHHLAAALNVHKRTIERDMTVLRREYADLPPTRRKMSL